MNVDLVGNIDDNSSDMRLLIRQLAPIHDISGDRKWKLRCRNVHYLGPWAVATIAACFLRGREKLQEPRVILPTEPAALEHYCVYSGMSLMFKNGRRPDPEHPECETIPLEQFHEASWDRSHRIIQLLQRHTTLNPESEDGLRTCIQEVVQNIVDHSESTIGGVMSARYMHQSNEVRVAIVDRGIGIAATLSRRFPEASDPQVALQRVMSGNYSSLSRPNNMGLGVSLLFDIVRNAGGSIAVVTANALAEIRRGSQAQVEGLDVSFPGTAVYFSLPL